MKTFLLYVLVLSVFISSGINPGVIYASKRVEVYSSWKNVEDGKNKAKVVLIDTYVKQDSKKIFIMTGAGTLLPNGYILTNYHIASDKYSQGNDVIYEIKFFNQTEASQRVNAKLIAFDESIDTSILLIDTGEIPYEYKNSYVEKFDTNYENKKSVRTIGHPFKPTVFSNRYSDNYTADVMNYWDITQGTIDDGSVPVTRQGYDGKPNLQMNVMSVNIVTYSGNSGGPLLNKDDELVGMHFASNVDKTMGYSIRSKDIKQFLFQKGVYYNIFTNEIPAE